MDTFLIVIGIFVIIGLIFSKYILPLMAKKQFLSTKAFFLGIAISIMTMASSGMFFYAEPGHSYLVQYPWGTQVAVLDPGYHLYWYGNVLDFKKVLTVRLTDFSDKDSETATAQDNSVAVRFNDSVMASISCSTRFRLPEDPVLFTRMALDYRSQQNLVQSSLVPVTREVIRNSARELSAQDYVTGQGGQFETNILDQMENGIVVLKIEDFDVDDSGESSVIPGTAMLAPDPQQAPIATQGIVPPDTAMVNSDQKGESRASERPVDNIKKTELDRGIRTNQKVYQRVVRVTNPDGSLKRKAHPILAYGIQVTQSTVEKVSFEEMFQKMLAKQRDAAAQAAVSRQEAKQAEYEKQKVIAQGETNKARIKMEQEQDQVQRIIAAETAKKEEEILLEKAEIEKRRVEVEAKALLAKADAESKARKMKMVADGALEQKLDAWVEINKAYAEAFSQQNVVPNVVVGASGGKTPTSADFMNIMTAMSAKQLGLDARIAD